MIHAKHPQANNDKLKAETQAYWKQGLAVLPFIIKNDKKRTIEDSWKQWPFRPQARNEFEVLHD